MQTSQTNTLEPSEEKIEQPEKQIAEPNADSINAERNRVSEIIKAVRTAQLEPQFAEGLIDKYFTNPKSNRKRKPIF